MRKIIIRRIINIKKKKESRRRKDNKTKKIYPFKCVPSFNYYLFMEKVLLSQSRRKLEKKKWLATAAAVS